MNLLLFLSKQKNCWSNISTFSSSYKAHVTNIKLMDPIFGYPELRKLNPSQIADLCEYTTRSHPY